LLPDERWGARSGTNDENKTIQGIGWGKKKGTKIYPAKGGGNWTTGGEKNFEGSTGVDSVKTLTPQKKRELRSSSKKMTSRKGGGGGTSHMSESGSEGMGINKRSDGVYKKN